VTKEIVIKEIFSWLPPELDGRNVCSEGKEKEEDVIGTFWTSFSNNSHVIICNFLCLWKTTH